MAAGIVFVVTTQVDDDLAPVNFRAASYENALDLYVNPYLEN